MKKTAYLLLALFTLSCNSGDECIEYPETKKDVNIDVIRIDKEFFKAKNENDLLIMINKYPDFSRKFLGRGSMPDEVLTAGMFRLVSDTGIAKLKAECENTFKDFSDLKKQYEDAYSLLKHYYPKTKTPKLYTFISGLNKDIAMNDSTIMLGVDFFLGPQAPYVPNIQSYMGARYTPDRILSISMKLLSEKYINTDFDDKSMLSEMIYFGKALYFTKRMLPCTQDSTIMGYTAKEWTGVENHQKAIWAHFVENKLFYEQNNFIKTKYVGESPRVTAIGDDCPGRIGRWLGWKIVERYMENNPEVTLQTLMEEKDAKKIFTLSNYKPD